MWVMQCFLLVIGSDATIVRKVRRVTGNGQREGRNEHGNQVRFCSHFFVSRSLNSFQILRLRCHPHVSGHSRNRIFFYPDSYVQKQPHSQGSLLPVPRERGRERERVSRRGGERTWERGWCRRSLKTNLEGGFKKILGSFSIDECDGSENDTLK